MRLPRGTKLPETLPSSLAALLRGYDRRWRFWQTLGRLAGFVLGVGGIVVLGCAFDRLFDVPGFWRLPLAPLAILAALVLGWRVVGALIRRPDYDAIAHALDQALGDRRGHLRSHLDFAAREDGGGPFSSLSRASALALWQDRQVRPFVPVAGARRLFLAAVLFVVAVAVGSRVEAVRAGLLWQRFLAPTGNHPRPTATWFEIEAPERLDGGDDFKLVAWLRGRSLPNPVPIARFERADGAEFVRQLRPGPDGSYALRLAEVQQDFHYVLGLHPARSARLAVRVRPRPTVVQATATYTYPIYTGIKPRVETLSGRTLTALEGTRVHLELVANLPLQAVLGTVEEEQRAFRVDRDHPTRAGRHHFMNRNERLDLVLVAENGLESRRELPYNIRVVADHPPMITAQAGWGERAVLATDTIQVFYKAQDDIGLSEVALRVENGEFVQEAQLERHGRREAQGSITVPVAQLVGPNTTRLRLRATALDLKGQSVSSPPLTLHVAVNAYDRQCRMARNALLGRPNSRNISESGFPSLARTEQRLAALNNLAGRLKILVEMLPETGRANPNQAPIVDEARQALATLAPQPDYLLPSIGARPDDITTSFDLLAAADLTPRLARLVAESVTAPDLAVAGSTLSREFAAALDAEPAKSAVAAFAGRLAAARPALAAVLACLVENQRLVEIELSGYLAASLRRDLAEGSGNDRWQDRDFLITRHVILRELAALLQRPLGVTVSEPVLAAMVAAAANQDGKQALEQSQAPLAQLLPVLEQAAVDASASWPSPDIPVVEKGERGRLDVQALKLIMQIDDCGTDESGLLQEAASYLERLGGGDSAPPVAVRNFELYVALSRFRASCESLRLGLASGRLSWEVPAGDQQWLELRELRFHLLRLLSCLPASSSLRPPLGELLDQTLPCVAWTLPVQPSLTLAARLADWEARSRALASECRDQGMAEAVSLLRDMGGRWRQLLAGAVIDFRAAIDRRIQEITNLQEAGVPYAMQRVVFGPLPRMYARNKAMQLLLIQYLGLADACAFHGVAEVGDVDDAAAFLVLLRRIEKELFENVGRPISNIGLAGVRDDAAMAEHAKVGKAKAWREVDQLVADLQVRLPVVDDVAGRDALLQGQVLYHQFAAEIEARQRAVRLLDTTTDQFLQDLKGDREGAAAVWAELQYDLEMLAEQAAADKRVPAVLRDRLGALGTLPRELSVLPGLLASDPGAPRWQDDLRGVLADLAPLARPPARMGEEAALAEDVLAAQRARVAVRIRQAPKHELSWAVTEMIWCQRKAKAVETHVGIGGLAIAGTDDLTDLKLPRHLYQELKRARESAMPELFRDRAYQYLNLILEKAR